MIRLIFIVAIVALAGCNAKEVIGKTTYANDANSYAEPEKAVVKHLNLEISVDFNSQTIEGKASWEIENTAKGKEIVFDENTLEIQKVTLGDDETPTEFTLGRYVEYHGKPLRITIGPTRKKSISTIKPRKTPSLCSGCGPNKRPTKNIRSCSRRAKPFGPELGFRARIHRESSLLTTRKLPFQDI